MAQLDTLPRAGKTAVVDTTPVRVWLLTVAALVFLLVSIGGATRLTGSGLSITEWKPIMGIVPPLSEADWQDAFEKYRQIPQYQQVNKGMSLGAFKRIFWWEWTHRFLGRLVGFAFLVPFLVLLAAGRIPAPAAAAAGRTICARRAAGLHRLVHGEQRPGRSHQRQPVPAGRASGARHPDPRCAAVGGAVAR